MRHLKKYDIFLEEAEFDVQDTDTPDVKVAKDGMNTMKLNLDEYKTKKSLIDKLYLEVKDPTQIESKLKEILGVTDIQNGKDRNPFLVEYAHLAKLKADIESMKQQNVYDKAFIDDFNQELRNLEANKTNDPTQKLVITKKIVDVNKRIADRTPKLTQIQNDFNKSFTEHNDKINKMGSDMTEYIKKISNVNQK
jgi:hypothetical protein